MTDVAAKVISWLAAKAHSRRMIPAVSYTHLDVYKRQEYVCKPSILIGSKASDFYAENQEICAYECEFIENTQKPDGTWAITWSWEDYDYPEEWSISKNWWKSDWIIKYIRYLKTIR